MLTRALTKTIDNQAVSLYIKFTSLSDGRDKLYRFFQYFSRFLVYHLSKDKQNQALVIVLANLQNSLAQARKVLRLGKFIDCLKLAVSALNSPGEELGNIITAAARVSLGGFIFFDGLSWASTLGLLNPVKAARFARVSMKCWFTSIVLNIVSSLYKLNDLRMQYKIIRRIEANSSPDEKDEKVLQEKKSLKASISAENKALITSLIDVAIPAGHPRQVIGIISILVCPAVED
ncbi:hypothetical protein BB560_004635 [Smittium megazygosporum]|uniref:Peroxisomal biogenesis factor 11 n=1 Tax=Smittium megazygosporum TaxID=133381 RepID=A0A2T9Z8P3_9FUNG|nr:hypothetical protein BB560_004635 [Smittium megazygosporum]